MEEYIVASYVPVVVDVSFYVAMPVGQQEQDPRTFVKVDGQLQPVG